MGDKSCGIPSGSTYPPWLSTILGIDNGVILGEPVEVRVPWVRMERSDG